MFIRYVQPPEKRKSMDKGYLKQKLNRDNDVDSEDLIHI
jgi:hypothetical protein